MKSSEQLVAQQKKATHRVYRPALCPQLSNQTYQAEKSLSKKITHIRAGYFLGVLINFLIVTASIKTIHCHFGVQAGQTEESTCDPPRTGDLNMKLHRSGTKDHFMQSSTGNWKPSQWPFV